jgi:hypothetical protein
MNVGDCAILLGDLDLARRRLRQGIELLIELDDRNGLFIAVCIAEGLMLAHGAHEQAARLMAASYGRRKAEGGRSYPLKEALTLPGLDDLRTALGEERFERAWTEGLAMPLDETVAYLRVQLAALA